MVRRFQGRPVPRIRDLYHDVLDVTMQAQNIAPLQQRPSHVVRTDASFEEVVQHTDWWLRRNDSRPDYRYRRYREMLGEPQPPRDTNTRLAHVDIGCGAGLWSWVLLDWARDSNLAYDRIDLFGLDHSSEMINLAYLTRSRLTPTIADYPNLYYTNSVEILLSELTAHHRDPTDYAITFGHVLVQAQSDDAILNFTRVIIHALRLINGQSQCALVAVDARGRTTEFALGWSSLLSSLEQYGVGYEQVVAQHSFINNSADAKIAYLTLAGKQEV